MSRKFTYSPPPTTHHPPPLRLALISDLHANLAAFEAVLAHLDAQAPDAIVCLGDLVGYGPQPNEVVDLVRKRGIPCVEGNHDAGVNGRMPVGHFREPNQSVIQWTRDHLTPDNLAFLQSLPLILDASCLPPTTNPACRQAGTNTPTTILFVHSSPIEPEKWTYLNSAVKCRQVMEQVDADLVFVGHTHIQGFVAAELGVFGFEKGERYVVNPGAVGQNRDGDPRAGYAMLDLDAWTCDFHKISYPVQETLDAYRSLGMDAATGRRLLHV